MLLRNVMSPVVCAVLVGGCSLVTDAPRQPPAPQPPIVTRPVAPAQTSSAAQRAFADRIMRASATNGVITRAAMRGGNELGVVLGRQVKLKEIKPLMVALLKEMRKEFPRRDLTVRAYAPDGKPMATMKYDDSAPPDSNVTYDTAGF